ncbi:MAG TPA: alpha/beta hydrolase-fold protein [Caulobacteraceae bacterium]|nr:alpha/beta hydrolase-fold protein [Caulobacteraceae bacterium]
MPRLICGLVAAACLVCSPAIADPAEAVRVLADTPYEPASSHQLTVHSERLGRDFVVVVSAPSSPLIEPGQKLPAIYALDGGYGIAGPIAQMMAWAVMMAPAYVIAIGYPDGKANERDTDFLHRATVRDGASIGGGGAAFQAFLSKDLRPFLEARYPLDPSKAILFGHSYGGLFAANVLASAPTSYAGYVIASPSVFADPQLLAGLAPAASKGQGRRVFVAVGAEETANGMVRDAGRVADLLSASPSTFVVQKRVFAGAGHISYYPLLVPAAFAWVLPVGSVAPPVQRHAIDVTPEELDRLVGVYSLADGRLVTVTRKGATLLAGMTGYPGGEVLAETPTRFFAPGLDVLMTFEVGAAGRASAVVVRINGAELRAIRTNP